MGVRLGLSQYYTTECNICYMYAQALTRSASYIPVQYISGTRSPGRHQRPHRSLTALYNVIRDLSAITQLLKRVRTPWLILTANINVLIEQRNFILYKGEGTIQCSEGFNEIAMNIQRARRCGNENAIILLCSSRFIFYIQYMLLCL